MKLQALDDGDLRPDQVEKIATRFGVTEKDVVSMNQRLGGDTSLNAQVRSDAEGQEWQDWLEDDQPSQEEALGESQELAQRQNYLERALGRLNERERRIFQARRLSEDPITLDELSQKFGVSRERIRQLEVRAFEKVQKAVKSAASSDDSGTLH